MTAHTHTVLTEGCYRCDLNKDEMAAQRRDEEVEAYATMAVLESAFAGYPMDANFATKEDAVTLLQGLWDIVDNWDGSGVNIEWAKTGRTRSGETVFDWARRRSAD